MSDSRSVTGSLYSFPKMWEHIWAKQLPVLSASVMKRTDVPSGRVRLVNPLSSVDFPEPSGAHITVTLSW